MRRLVRSLAKVAVYVSTTMVVAAPSHAGSGEPTPRARHRLAAAAGTTGTWVGTLEVGDWSRALALQIHERRDGDLLVYALGLTEHTSIASGRRDGSSVTLDLEFAALDGDESVGIQAGLDGETLEGTAVSSSGVGSVHLHRTHTPLTERRFVFAVLDGDSDASALAQLAVALDPSGGLVAGGFAAEKTCDLWACRGAVTAFSEVGSTLTVSPEVPGGCSSGSSATLTFDPAQKIYLGTYTFSDCTGTTTGPVAAARIARATNTDIAAMLAGLARFADDIEADVPLVAPNPVFASGYLHNGWSQTEVLAAINTEIDGYEAISASFVRLRAANTVFDPDLLPDAPTAFGLAFDAVRSGIPAAGGARVTYLDTHLRPTEDNRLRIWDHGPGGWRIAGNQFAALRLPFDYTIGGNALEISTPGGTVYASIGAYGAHFFPHTGHTNGDAKSNIVGFFTRDDGDLTELVGDGDGIREEGETWGFFGGAGGELIRDRTPVYTAPSAGTLTALEYFEGPAGVYFDNPPHWRFELQLSPEVRLFIGHVGRIAAPLRDAVLAATGIDTDTYAGPPAELLHGNTVPVTAGMHLASPQVLATPVPGHPGYYAGGGSFLDRPWAQMEFTVIGPTGESGNDHNADVCVYDFMSGADRSALQAMMATDMDDPASQRYGGIFAPERWLWSAEGRVCMTYSPRPNDFSSLYTDFGGWIEVDGPATTADELVTFAPIATDAPSYDPLLYDSPAVSMLIARRRSIGLSFSWSMPDGSTVTPFAPNGEILELGADSLLVKWRSIGYGTGGAVPVYQRASYRLDPVLGLKIGWGPFASSPAATTAPALAAGTPCDDAVVICYDHVLRPGF